MMDTEIRRQLGAYPVTLYDSEGRDITGSDMVKRGYLVIIPVIRDEVDMSRSAAAPKHKVSREVHMAHVIIDMRQVVRCMAKAALHNMDKQAVVCHGGVTVRIDRAAFTMPTHQTPRDAADGSDV